MGWVVGEEAIRVYLDWSDFFPDQEEAFDLLFFPLPVLQMFLEYGIDGLDVVCSADEYGCEVMVVVVP